MQENVKKIYLTRNNYCKFVKKANVICKYILRIMGQKFMLAWIIKNTS
jgi:hypothetical protein